MGLGGPGVVCGVWLGLGGVGGLAGVGWVWGESGGALGGGVSEEGSGCVCVCGRRGLGVATSIRMNPFALKLAFNRLRSDTFLATDALKLLPQVKEYVMRFAAEAPSPPPPKNDWWTALQKKVTGGQSPASPK